MVVPTSRAARAGQPPRERPSAAARAATRSELENGLRASGGSQYAVAGGEACSIGSALPSSGAAHATIVMPPSTSVFAALKRSRTHEPGWSETIAASPAAARSPSIQPPASASPGTQSQI